MADLSADVYTSNDYFVQILLYTLSFLLLSAVISAVKHVLPSDAQDPDFKMSKYLTSLVHSLYIFIYAVFYAVRSDCSHFRFSVLCFSLGFHSHMILRSLLLNSLRLDTLIYRCTVITLLLACLLLQSEEQYVFYFYIVGQVSEIPRYIRGTARTFSPSTQATRVYHLFEMSHYLGYIGLRTFLGTVVTLSMFWNIRDYSPIKLVYLASALGLNLLLVLFVDYYEQKASKKTLHGVPDIPPTADELGLLRPHQSSPQPPARE